MIGKYFLNKRKKNPFLAQSNPQRGPANHFQKVILGTKFLTTDKQIVDSVVTLSLKLTVFLLIHPCTFMLATVLSPMV